MRRLYTLILYLIAPAVVLRLFVRSLKAPDYRRRIRERFGHIPYLSQGGGIWLHAVSVGETQAALPLIQALRRRAPKRPMVITTTTPTGSARVQAALGEDVHHFYLPYDLPGSLRRFLDAARPVLVIIMETEIWPNLFAACQDRGIPLVIANARISPASFKGYKRVRPFVAESLARTSLISAQSEMDAERFRQLGAPTERVRALGNIKFDLRYSPETLAEGSALREKLGLERPVWIAASTHDGEEFQVLEAFREVRQRIPDALLILVPRHPERFDAVAAQCRGQGWRIVRRTEHSTTADCDVYLGDTMGELMVLYGAADVAFVGGSLVPIGGHNVLEPAAVGLTVLFGPHMFNFIEASERLLEANAAHQVQDAKSLAKLTVELLRDAERRDRMGRAGRDTVAANRGSLERLLNALEPLL